MSPGRTWPPSAAGPASSQPACPGCPAGAGPGAEVEAGAGCWRVGSTVGGDDKVRGRSGQRSAASRAGAPQAQVAGLRSGLVAAGAGALRQARNIGQNGTQPQSKVGNTCLAAQCLGCLGPGARQPGQRGGPSAKRCPPGRGSQVAGLGAATAAPLQLLLAGCERGDHAALAGMNREQSCTFGLAF